MIRLHTPRRLALIALLLLLSLPALAEESVTGFCSTESYSLREDEVNQGDLYFAGNHVDVAGRHEGDLFAMGQSMVVSGHVTGDVGFFGQSLDLSGRVDDSVRVWGYTVTVTGTIEGDLVAGGLQVSIHPRAHIKGNVYVFGSMASIEGTVDGDLQFFGGKVDLGGNVGRDVRIKADAIEISAQATIGGDLRYESRKPLQDDLSTIVAGEVSYSEPKKSDTDDGPWITLTSVIWWIWFTLSALVVSYIILGAFPAALDAAAEPLRGEAMTSSLIGFGALLIVPAAGAIALALLPLGVITLFLFAVAVYLAKVPVALWLGRRLLGRSAAAPSAAVALTLGIVLLRLLFQIPYLGGAIWILTVCLGLGSMLLAVRRRRAGNGSPGDTTGEAMATG